MRIKNYITCAIFALGGISSAVAAQPYGGCWHPVDIVDWDPQKDPDAKFNRSLIPLQPRFKEESLMKANAAQHYEGEICNATILYHRCSTSPSQGAENFLGYQPTYWQYMDKLVYWAGSAGEGIIVPPPAGSIDAAHLSGVKVLGQIFFPPTYYGGKDEWVRQMLTQQNGHYPFAQKLYQIAKYMGFDGWFINEETGTSIARDWVDFIKEFNSLADAAGDTQMEIQWYDATRQPVPVLLQSHPNTSQFLEYGAVGDNRKYAAMLKCTEAETFSKLYSGVECVKAGLTGYNAMLDLAFPSDGHVGSIALFCPEEHSWKDNVRDLLDNPKADKEQVYAAIEQTFRDEETAWVNRAGDPSNTSDSEWRGISGAILERSSISSLPFASDMSVGNGKHHFIKGEKRASGDWYNSSVQSQLPTWRWWIENRGGLKVDVDWDDAYNLGSSFRIHGAITAGDHLMRLYKTQIALENATTLRVVFKTDGETPELQLSTTSSVTPDITLPATAITNLVGGWQQAEYDLASLNGKTIRMIALNLKSATANENYSFSLGAISLLASDYSPVATEIRNATVDAELGEDKGSIRVSWDYDYSNDFERFDIYVRHSDDTRTLAGHTRGEGFYIPEVMRRDNEASVDVEIVAVMKDMSEGAPVSVKADFPAPTAPKVTFKPSKSYIKVGETATIEVRATGNTESVEWTLPAGLELTDGTLTDMTITVKGVSEGRQEVTLKATNSIGTSDTRREVIDVLDDEEYATVRNVVLKKRVVDYSGSTNSTETPAKIIDGVTNPASVSDKWCSQTPDNWVVFDCEQLYRFYGFRIYDCKSGPENAENISDYRIEVSEDGNNWQLVTDETGREADNIKDDAIAPTAGRYIRFSPQANGVLRIWEFEAYGTETESGISTINPDAERVITDIYNTQGQRLGSLQPGICIVRYSDGSVEKLFVTKQ